MVLLIRYMGRRTRKITCSPVAMHAATRPSALEPCVPRKMADCEHTPCSGEVLGAQIRNGGVLETRAYKCTGILSRDLHIEALLGKEADCADAQGWRGGKSQRARE